MIVNCDQCGKPINKRPSAIRKFNFCDKKCRHDYRHTTITCTVCGKKKEVRKIAVSKNPMCSLACARKFNSKRFTEMNKELNPERMTFETRTKVREARLDPNATSYPKYYGKHEHRMVAARKIGRPLKKGEVVHHKDGNRRNNHPDNLEVLPSQAEHARLHAEERRKNKKC